jgi:hypothetical protein
MTEKIDAQINRGEHIQALPRTTTGEVEVFKDDFFTWSEYTSALLENSFDVQGVMTPSPSSDFGASDLELIDIKLGLTLKTAEYINAAISSNLPKKLRALRSIRERLPIWHETPAPVQRHVSGDAIFLVHGRNHEARETVRSFLIRCAQRDVIVLDEAPGLGADILGKLLTHAEKASYAVVLLTGDDEGRAIGDSDLRHRARQNVILELGLFIGMLGRTKVIALYEPGVEIPSDYLGVTYVELDSKKAWRMSLVGELRAAGIEASIDKML